MGEAKRRGTQEQRESLAKQGQRKANRFWHLLGVISPGMATRMVEAAMRNRGLK